MQQTHCEVCGKPVNFLADYADALSGKAYSPREYIEHQLHMTEDEKRARTLFFEELFSKHDREKG